MQCLKFFVVVFFATLAREALTKHLWHQIPMASWPNPLCWLMMTLLWHWWPDFFIIAKLSWGDRRIQWITMDWVSMVLHRYMKFEGQYNDRLWQKIPEGGFAPVGNWTDLLLYGFKRVSVSSLKPRTPSFQRVCAFFVSMTAVTLGRFVTSTLSCTLMIFIPSLQQKMMKKQRMLEREAC